MNQDNSFVLKILCVEGGLLQALCTWVIKGVIALYWDYPLFFRTHTQTHTPYRSGTEIRLTKLYPVIAPAGNMRCSVPTVLICMTAYRFLDNTDVSRFRIASVSPSSWHPLQHVFGPSVVWNSFYVLIAHKILIILFYMTQNIIFLKSPFFL